RHRTEVWTHRRQHLSGRTDARTTVLPAAGSRLGAVSNADPQPLYVRLRDASRRWNHGSSGPQCSERHSRRLEARKNLMPASSNRVVVIGGGHNGLVAACYLAKAGFAPIVLERRNVIGGSAVTEEIHPGFQCPALAHSLGPLFPGIA